MPNGTVRRRDGDTLQQQHVVHRHFLRTTIPVSLAHAQSTAIRMNGLMLRVPQCGGWKFLRVGSTVLSGAAGSGANEKERGDHALFHCRTAHLPQRLTVEASPG